MEDLQPIMDMEDATYQQLQAETSNDPIRLMLSDSVAL